MYVAHYHYQEYYTYLSTYYFDTIESTNCYDNGFCSEGTFLPLSRCFASLSYQLIALGARDIRNCSSVTDRFENQNSKMIA